MIQTQSVSLVPNLHARCTGPERGSLRYDYVIAREHVWHGAWALSVQHVFFNIDAVLTNRHALASERYRLVAPGLRGNHSLPLWQRKHSLSDFKSFNTTSTLTHTHTHNALTAWWLPYYS